MVGFNKEMAQVSISVIVPVYEQWDIINNLLSALAKQTLNKNFWELIVVDNGSAKVPKASIIEQLDFSARLIVCNIPGSYAARREAVARSSGSLLVFTDADCIPSDGWLFAIYEEASKNPNVLIAGAMEVKCLHTGKPNIAELYDTILGLPQKRYASKGWGVTANLAVPRSVYDNVGGFAEDRFSGGDSLFCLEAKKKGYHLIYLPRAVVIHPARDKVSELFRKFRRVKGGQIRSGSRSRRFKFFLWTIIPPFRQFKEVFFTKELRYSDRFSLFLFLIVLWFVGVIEMVRLLFGAKPERR